MIPIKLEFQAFGPFAKLQVIDFNKLCESRLFLISGQTGSGKTTIFDAISFALFGQPSGSVRSNDGLKSHFTDDSTECYVRFTFNIKGEIYTVYREPPQNKLRRNGAISKSLPSAELTLSNGDIIGSIKAVNEKISELIGLDSDQFRKIAMLPQGEFRKFISEKTSDKQITLREIFKTEQLDQFTKRLAERVSECKQKLNDIGNITQGSINNICFEHNEQLKLECEKGYANLPAILSYLNDDNSNLAQKKSAMFAECEDIERQLKLLNLQYYIDLNRSFQTLDLKQKEFDKLNQKSNHIDAQKSTLSILNKAKLIAPLSTQIESIKLKIEQHKNSLLSLGKEKIFLISECEHLLPILDNAQTLAKKTNSIIVEIEKLKQQYSIFTKIENMNAEITNSEKELVKKNEVIEKLSRHIEKIELTDKLEQSGVLSEKVRNAIAYCEHKNTTQVEYVEISDRYKSSFERFISSQAAILSISLVDEAPCPVCGSKVHPSPAKHLDDTVTEIELEQIKTVFNDVTKQLEKISAKCDAVCTELEVESGDLVKLNELYNLYIVQSNLLRLELEKYADITTSATFEAVVLRISEVKQSIITTQQDIVNWQNQISDLNQQVDLSMSGTDIEQEIIRLQSHINDVTTHYETISKQFNDAQSNLKSNQTAIEQAEKYFEIQQEEYEILKGKLSSKLLEIKFTQDEFNAVNTNCIDENIQKITAELNEYRENYIAIKSVIESLKSQLDGKSPANICELQEKCTALTSKLDNLKDIVSKLSYTLAQNESIYKNILNNSSEYKTTEQKFTQYNDIYSVANGNKSERTTFESYVLSYYFNQVIDNANIRLAQMTNRRYTIFIRQEREKYGAYSGLELNVLDSHTGRQRDVATLSGGESFKLALALSLALADITTEHSGGVEINTLFIDEGFGSLDPDSIATAIECLNSIQLQGRYVGVISHVAELKEKIPSKIVVNQSPSGSSIQLEF